MGPTNITQKFGVTTEQCFQKLTMKIQLFFLVCFTAGAFSLYSGEHLDEPTEPPKTIAPWMQACLDAFTKCQADAHSLKELRKCNYAFYKCKFGKCKKICRWEEIKCHAAAKTKEAILACKAAVAPCLRENGC